ncbi:MAG: phenylacetate-CoA oxygenase subunit PaaC [Gammaproteobacteria bacterium]|nr:phenylacetate-CoA oxygenase subunit PaaC [Gammaproteobacteria bacterium]
MSLLDAVVGLADDALVLGHRLSEWCGRAPFLEEDLAIANTALDLLGRARTLYGYAETLGGRNEDEYAFLRDAPEFRNLLIYELPGDDFAAACARQFLVDVFDDLYLTELAASRDETLAELGAKCGKESTWHRRHSGEWLNRLGDGTAESHERMQRALEGVWGYHLELFETGPGETRLVASGVLPDRGALERRWSAAVHEAIRSATLDVPSNGRRVAGGRAGEHTEHLGIMLAEMQQLPRACPGANW